MSEALAPKNVADRRGFLTLALLPQRSFQSPKAPSRAISTITTRSVVEARPGTQNNVRNQKTLQTATSLRDLWLGHIFWVRNVSVAAIDKNDAATKAAEQQAVANAKAHRRLNRAVLWCGCKRWLFQAPCGPLRCGKGLSGGDRCRRCRRSGDSDPVADLKRRRDRDLPEQGKSVSAERCGAGPPPCAWRSSHPADPATEGSKIRSRGTNLGRDEAARLSDRRCDGRRLGQAIRQEVLLNNIGPTR